jgi:hypothetical protein
MPRPPASGSWAKLNAALPAAGAVSASEPSGWANSRSRRGGGRRPALLYVVDRRSAPGRRAACTPAPLSNSARSGGSAFQPSPALPGNWPRRGSGWDRDHERADAEHLLVELGRERPRQLVLSTGTRLATNSSRKVIHSLQHTAAGRRRCGRRCRCVTRSAGELVEVVEHGEEERAGLLVLPGAGQEHRRLDVVDQAWRGCSWSWIGRVVVLDRRAPAGRCRRTARGGAGSRRTACRRRRPCRAPSPGRRACALAMTLLDPADVAKPSLRMRARQHGACGRRR